MSHASEQTATTNRHPLPRTRDEQAQPTAKRRTEVILRGSMDGFWLVDARGFIHEPNPAVCEMLGYTADQLAGMHLRDIDVVETPEQTRQRMLDISATGSQRFETRHRRKDGVVIDVEVSAHSAELDGEHFFFVFLRDITGRKRSEDALRKSEEMVQKILETAPVGIISIDANDFVLTWNRAAEKIFGWKAEEVIGRRLPFVDDHERDEFVRLFDPEIKGASGIELQRRRKDGSLVDIVLWTTPRRDESGALISSLGIVVDITERRLAEQALRQSEARWRSLVENAPGFIVMLDREGRIRFINRVLPNFDHAQVLQATAYDFLSPQDSDRARRALSAVFDRKVASSIDLVGPGAAGAPVWYNCTYGPVVQDGRVIAAIGIIHDITERKRAEEEARTRSELEQLLFRELDHRVRNNLSSLIALVDMVRDNAVDARGLARGIRERVLVMAAAHNLLSQSHWAPLDLRTIIEAVAPGLHRGCVTMAGPAVAVSPRQVTAVGMVINELMTNSHKHGALQLAQGRVAIAWELDAATSTGARLKLQWREHGGPPVLAEPRSGLGTELIQGLVRSELYGEVILRFPREGAAHDLVLTLEHFGARDEHCNISVRGDALIHPEWR